MIASRSCCRFVGCTSMMWISRSTTSQKCSIGKWTHCHVQETSLRWFELCDMEHYPARSSIRRWVHCSHKGMNMVHQYSGRLWCLNKAQQCCLNNAWTVETSQDGSMLSCFLRQILTLTSECSRNQDSSDQATFLQSSIVQFWRSCVNCILRVLFLSDRSGTRCGLLLL